MSSCINTQEADDTENHVNAYTHNTSTVISDLRNACGEQTDISYQAAKGSTGTPPRRIPLQQGKMSHGCICIPLPNKIRMGGHKINTSPFLELCCAFSLIS